MFNPFKKKESAPQTAPALPAVTSLPPDPEMRAEQLRAGIEKMVAFLQMMPAADDDALEKILRQSGLSENQATKLIQFVPIAFTRFLFREKGVQFAPNYVLVNDKMQPLGQHPIAEVVAYSEAWKFCAEAAAKGKTDDYFHPIAARSGGYGAIQQLVDQGSNLDGIVTSPPMMFA